MEVELRTGFRRHRLLDSPPLSACHVTREVSSAEAAGAHLAHLCFYLLLRSCGREKVEEEAARMSFLLTSSSSAVLRETKRETLVFKVMIECLNTAAESSAHCC